MPITALKPESNPEKPAADCRFTRPAAGMKPVSFSLARGQSQARFEQGRKPWQDTKKTKKKITPATILDPVLAAWRFRTAFISRTSPPMGPSKIGHRPPSSAARFAVVGIEATNGSPATSTRIGNKVGRRDLRPHQGEDAPHPGQGGWSAPAGHVCSATKLGMVNRHHSSGRRLCRCRGHIRTRSKIPMSVMAARPAPTDHHRQGSAAPICPHQLSEPPVAAHLGPYALPTKMGYKRRSFIMGRATLRDRRRGNSSAFANTYKGWPSCEIRQREIKGGRLGNGFDSPPSWPQCAGERSSTRSGGKVFAARRHPLFSSQAKYGGSSGSRAKAARSSAPRVCRPDRCCGDGGNVRDRHSRDDLIHLVLRPF